MSDQELHTALPDLLARADTLPSLPAVAVEVLRLTRDDASTLDELADVISRDPVLAAKLLELASSPLFRGPGPELLDLRQAAMTLGFNTVRLMSLSFSLAGSLARQGTAGGFPHSAYWQHSLCAAVAGRAFGALVRSRFADEAFTCALLGRIGQLVLAHGLADEYERVLARTGGALPASEAERAVLGFDSADVGRAVLRSWELPDELCDVVGFHVRPDELPAGAGADTLAICRLANVAELTARVLCDGANERSLARLTERCARWYELDAAAVDAFVAGLRGGVEETAALLRIEIPRQGDYAEIVEEARRRLLQLGVVASLSLAAVERRAHVLEATNRELWTQLRTDALTGLCNRAFLDETLRGEVARRAAGDVPLALGLLMIDVDRFKALNDAHGHQAGDCMLRAVADRLRVGTRKSDLPARYGGEEFAVIAPETTIAGLRVLAERVRASIEELAIEHEGATLRVTVSVGGACLARVESPDDAAKLVRLADHFLYVAKERGRNRCEIWARDELPRR